LASVKSSLGSWSMSIPRESVDASVVQDSMTGAPA
jgi:hypothetical protein